MALDQAPAPFDAAATVLPVRSPGERNFDDPIGSDRTASGNIEVASETPVRDRRGSEPAGNGALTSEKQSFLRSRDPRERKAGLLMAAGMVGLLAVQLGAVRPSLERKLTKRAKAVLELDGSNAITVSASGRDLSLAGYAANPEARERAMGLVKARRGVRVVNGDKLLIDAGLAAAGGTLSLDGGPSTATPAANAPVFTGDGAADQGAVEPVPSSVDPALAASAAALEAERAKPMRRAKISARVSGGKVIVEGSVPSEEGRDQLLGRTRQNLGEDNVTDALVLASPSEERADLNDYRRVGQLLSIAASFPGAELALGYDRGTLKVSGTVTSANDLALAQGETRKLVPDDSLRDVQLSIGSTPTEVGLTGASVVPSTTIAP